jgi:methylenetetrahydrofolate dehydrogenase (NADP+) / methenyltetrahydrofolate cyclohydrolase
LENQENNFYGITKKTMETKILNGVPYKDRAFGRIKEEISELSHGTDERPGITFIAMTGHEPLMKYTIGLHQQAAAGLGFNVKTELFNCDVQEKTLFELIDRLNADESVHAIILLQPVPLHINAIRIINHIDPVKEVEGFHSCHLVNMLSRDVQKIRYPMVLPTALDELFSDAGIRKNEGSEWVFVADDEFFSRPFTNMVVKTACPQVVPDNCSITIVNKNSPRMAALTGRADFLIVVSKCPGYIRREWLKPGVCIVDVYSNLIDEIPSKKHPGEILPVIRGGVFTEMVNSWAGILAPCPGGLMPVVLAVLFSNALKAFKLKTLKYEINNQDFVHV